MITGVDYVFYSNKSPWDLEKDFIFLLKNMWNELVVEEFERTDCRLEFFFAKDESMNYFFSQKGYMLDENGEGCFMLIASMIKRFKSEVEVLSIDFPEQRRNTDKYSSFLLFSNIWEYTLVLPSDVSSNKFSNKIFMQLEEMLI